MPKIDRVVEKPKKSSPLKPGSILSEAIPIDELDDLYLKVGIYGENRVGKTTLIATFPKPMLIVAFEPSRSGGALSIRNVPGIDMIRLRSSEKAVKLANELSRGNKYKTVALEGATSLQDVVLAELMDLPEEPAQMGWGTVAEGVYLQRAEITRETLRKFLNLPMHTVVTAKEKDHSKREEGSRTSKMMRKADSESYFAAELGGGTASWMYDTFDYIGRLCVDNETKIIKRKVKFKGEVTIKEEEVQTGKTVRRLYVTKNPNYMAGFRSAHPDKVPDYIEEPNFQKMYDVIWGV